MFIFIFNLPSCSPSQGRPLLLLVWKMLQLLQRAMLTGKYFAQPSHVCQHTGDTSPHLTVVLGDLAAFTQESFPRV